MPWNVFAQLEALIQCRRLSDQDVDDTQEVKRREMAGTLAHVHSQACVAISWTLVSRADDGKRSAFPSGRTEVQWSLTGV